MTTNALTKLYSWTSRLEVDGARSPLAAALRRKNAEIETLRERVRQLESALAPAVALPAEWPHLTPQQRAVLRCLVARDVATYAALRKTLEIGGYGHDLVASSNSLAVQVWHLKTKLRPFGVTIANVRTIGYSLDSSTRRRLRAAGAIAQ